MDILNKESCKRAAANIIRSAYSILVVNNGGLALHASAVLRHDRAHIFFGPSGSGKTTIANLCKKLAVLDDESIFIKRRNSSYQASGKRLRGSFPIQGIYKLTQDKKVYLNRLPKNLAMVELFTVPAFLKGLAWHKRLLANLSNLTVEIPCFDLHFRQDDSFWRCIDEYNQNLSK